MRIELWTVTLLLSLPGLASAATPGERVEAAAASGKHSYVMFYRSDDDRTQSMAETIEGFVSQRPDETSWVKVNVTDSAGKDLVERFKASRLPLPAVFGLAPNGAITFVRKLAVDTDTLEGGIVTPQCSAMVEALQRQKVTVVCFHPSGSPAIPKGVQALARDRNLGPQLSFVSAIADDPAEARFFQRMRVERDITSPAVLVFAPPGSFIGRFPANVSSATLAKAIHGSGKCNCKKCRHGN